MDNFYNPYGGWGTGVDPALKLQNLQSQISQLRPQLGNPGNVIPIRGGIESVRMYQTLPNSKYALFEEDDDVFWYVTTDASNYKTITRFRFYKEDEADLNPKYVTLEEFNKFKEEFLNGQQSVRECPDADDEPKHLK